MEDVRLLTAFKSREGDWDGGRRWSRCKVALAIGLDG
jgi:hypothetical protein